ncbi:MAG: hypothetical protein HQM10_09320 [Candidatus Riflebacteria bacterium]|nr:hypothetical protein [Candidatus Riflebacteria bacterium]
MKPIFNALSGLFVLLFVCAITCTANADMAEVEAFLSRRTDVYENIRNWSGKSDKVWILREWVKITTERNADYDEARRILSGLSNSDSNRDSTGSSTVVSSDGSVLDKLGVKIIRANVEAGTLYWKLIDVQWQDEKEGGGRHAIYFEPLDKNGERAMSSQPVVNGEKIRNDQKPAPEYMTNFPMYNTLGAYSAWMDGLPSDKIEGMGLGTPELPKHTIHTCFLLKFQQVIAGGENTGSDIPNNTFPSGTIPDSNSSSISGSVSGNFSTLSINGNASDRPADKHPDINLSIRGWTSCSADKGLANVSGSTDSQAPKFRTIFDPPRLPAFSSTYRVYDWDWGSMSRGQPITKWEATLLGMKTSPGEILRVPDSGYDIGSGKMVLVLYASSSQITLKYTREDNIVNGYAIHFEKVAVDPDLLNLYIKCVKEGRRSLPALAAREAFGRAQGDEILIAIRDTGEFMDPRIEKDWW